MMLSLACAFVRVLWSSIRRELSWPWCGLMLWFEQWLEWWWWLIPSWHVVLESAKDQILGVDTPGQYVPPCVQYEMAWLLIRNTIASVSCSVEWGMTSHFVKCLSHMVWEGTFVWETLAMQAWTVCSSNHSEAWHTLVVDLCNNM
jgi:hypothetical protein